MRAVLNGFRGQPVPGVFDEFRKGLVMNTGFFKFEETVISQDIFMIFEVSLAKGKKDLVGLIVLFEKAFIYGNGFRESAFVEIEIGLYFDGLQVAMVGVKDFSE